ncbi:MAG: hypothetical protein ACKOZU_10350 [Planctomycetaceae bacterium]
MSDDDKTRVSGGRRPAAPQAGRAPRIEGGKIVFYCPSGHRIAADRALAGRSGGKCSKCGAPLEIPDPAGDAAGVKIVIPGEDRPAAGDGEETVDATQDLLPDLDVAAPAPAGGADGDADEPTWDFVAAPAAEPPPALPDIQTWAAEPTIDVGTGDNPTAQLVARLWAERDLAGGIVELHLAGGSVMLPEFFDRRWSQGTHGLFATRAADGTVTITAVAWETVQKIVVRQLAAVPHDMFE